MFIQTEDTPNPATLKFLPGCTVMETGTASFSGMDEAARSPLAQRLLAISGVASVFLGSDFISVTKSADRDWPVLRAPLLAAIMEHFTTGQPVLLDPQQALPEHGNQGDNDEIATQIRELLDTRIRPAVAQDGGDITFQRFEDGVVYLTMKGACAGCPSSTATLKGGIENMLRHYIPEVTEVRAA
ncbi:MAG: NifU family protein [Pseudomonadota bacterium]|nr:NifU family protein [Pseudomonadota bacterium]